MLRSRGKELVFVWNPIILCAIIKGIIKSEHLQKGTPFCEAACCSTFRVFVPFRPVTEGSQRRPYYAAALQPF